jgi:hypothetical protein
VQPRSEDSSVQFFLVVLKADEQNAAADENVLAGQGAR